MDSETLLDDVGFGQKAILERIEAGGAPEWRGHRLRPEESPSAEILTYHLAVDWWAAFDEHLFTMTLSVNSSVCLHCVRCHVTGRPNVIPMCSGSTTAGKTEKGKVNWVWPGGQLEPTFRWTLERTVRDGGVSFPRTGETYPGFDL